MERESLDVVVVGAGQAGLSVAWHLARKGLRFAVLERNPRIGDVWRRRWDSLRLFTPAKYDGLVGLPFPGDPEAFPTKDEMADYLEGYAAHFELPVRTGVTVERVWREGGRFVVDAGREIVCDHVVVATASYQRPRVPAFGAELDPAIVQLHSSEYTNPRQLRQGGVLLVGAGNSGAEIARELAGKRQVWLSGRDVGEVPFRMESAAGRKLFAPLVLRFVFHHVLTTDTPLGRKVRPGALTKAVPLIRVKGRDLTAAGVERVPRTVGVEGGRPRLEDGRVLDVANVVWCTGFHPSFAWLDVPVFDARGEPRHDRGIATDVPGLSFCGLHFQYAMSSTMIHGVGRDAERVVDSIVGRRAA